MNKRNSHLLFRFSFLLIFLFSFSFFTFSQQKSRTQIRAALIRSADSCTAVHYEEMASSFYPNELDSGVFYLKLGIAKMRKCKSKPDEARMIKTMAGFYYLQNLYDSSMYFYRNAIRIYDRIPEDKNLGEAYRGLGLCYFDKGEYTNSVVQYQKALNVFESVHDSLGIGRTLNSLGTSLETMGNTEDALEYYQRSLRFKMASKDSSGMSVGQMNIGNVLTKLKRKQAAFDAYNEALSLARRLKNTRIIIDALSCRAASHFEFGETVAAEMDYKEALSLFGEYENSMQLANIYNGLAALYNRLKSYDLASEYASKNIPVCRSIGAKDLLKRSYYEYAQSQAGLENYEKAYGVMMEYAMFKDSLYDSENHLAVQEIKAKYEKEKDARMIADLKYQSNLDHIEQSRQSTLNSVYFFAFLIVLFLLIFLLIVSRRNFRMNRLLKRSVREKDILLKEVHHRVKNNFQLISSLLNLQGNTITDPTALASMEKSKNRIMSMALVHQFIYKAKDLSCIRMDQYIQELSKMISRSADSPGFEMQWEIDAENVEFDVDTTIPLGLILNELITNSYKYAFVGKSTGKISIALKHISDAKCLLTYRDNGVGLPADFNLDQLNSLGMELVQLLVAQLKGTIKVKNDNGACFEMMIHSK